jgi:acyl carrier protein
MSSLKELQDLAHEKFGIEPSELNPDTSMREKGFDSLALVEFLFLVEDKYGISLSDTESNVDTLGELSLLVDKAIKAKAA